MGQHGTGLLRTGGSRSDTSLVLRRAVAGEGSVREADEPLLLDVERHAFSQSFDFCLPPSNPFKNASTA